MRNKQHPLYRVWTGMRARCNNPNSNSYPNYGAKGITVCDRWDDFQTFVSDMGERPEGYTLDRIDVTKPYSPDNCRWADWHTQNCNRNAGGTGTIYKKAEHIYFVCMRFFGKRFQRNCSTLEEAEMLRSILAFERGFYLKLGYYYD